MTAVLEAPVDWTTTQADAERRRRVRLAIVAGVAVALLWLSLSIGSDGLLSPADVVGGLVGTGDRSVVFVVQQLRLPRAVAALLIGVVLGASGTMFQRVLGNPLASPDFLGIAAGASTATVAALVLGTGAGVVLPAASLAGGVVTAAVIALFAWHRGVSAYRFVLIGIGVSSFAASVTSYLIARAEFRDARAAVTWLVGSVGLTPAPMLVTLVVAAALLIPLGLLAGRSIRVLELGDDTARALGVRVDLARTAVLLLGVALVSVATAAAGPIAFIALLAGPLAALLMRAAPASIASAAAVGAVLLQVADLVAQHALPWPISTGVVTGLFGAPYVIWVLISTARKADG